MTPAEYVPVSVNFGSTFAVNVKGFVLSTPVKSTGEELIVLCSSGDRK